MNEFLPYVVIIMLLIVVLGFINERRTKLTYEIALMLFSIILGAVLVAVHMIADDNDTRLIINDVISFDLEDYLMKGVLCYMLFAGSCQMRLKDFKKQKRQITVLSIFATLFGAVFYGGVFYLVSCALKLGLSLPVCLMFGSIVSPTDPIAATSILNKFDLPEDISFLIESESLLNDGVGVALFVCFSGIVRASGSANFFVVFFRELFGAVIVGVVVTVLCFYIFYKTQDSARQIFVSILAVSSAYLLCEIFDFSGAIASVVCGVLFSALIKRFRDAGKEWHLEEYDVFWSIADNLLNSVLYVILGLTFIGILKTPDVILVSLGAIVCNLIGRAASVGLCTFSMGPIPSGFDKKNFINLMTWGGLRGALCIALAMSTKSMIPDETYRIILGGTYAIVAFTTIVQGLTMPVVYRKIKKSML